MLMFFGNLCSHQFSGNLFHTFKGMEIPTAKISTYADPGLFHTFKGMEISVQLLVVASSGFPRCSGGNVPSRLWFACASQRHAFIFSWKGNPSTGEVAGNPV